MDHHWQKLRTLSAQCLPLAASCYPPLVLGLAAFLLALLCCQTSPPEYQAEAVVLRAAADDGFRSDDLGNWLTSEAVLRATLLNARWPELSDRTGATEQHRLITEFRERMNLTALHQPDESPRLAVRCTAARGSVATKLASELARQVTENFEVQRAEVDRRQSESKLEEVHERLRLVRDAEERQRGELERLRHTQLAMAAANPRPISSASSRDSLNPRWVELKSQLDSLHSQRSEMLEILTETHPEIAGLDLRIAKVSGSLGKTPRLLAEPIEPITPGNASPLNRQTLLKWRRGATIAQQQYQQPLPGAEITSRQGLDPFLNLASQIDEAAHHLGLLTGQRKGLEWDAAELEQSLSQSAPVISTWHAQPTRRVAKLGGGYTAGQVQWAQLIALGGVGLAILAKWRILGGKRLLSLADVLIHVRLPLTGVVEIAPQPETSSFWRIGTTPLRMATRSSEAFLLGILATCLALGWLDPALGSEFALDPLGAFAESARRIL